MRIAEIMRETYKNQGSKFSNLKIATNSRSYMCTNRSLRSPHTSTAASSLTVLFLKQTNIHSFFNSHNTKTKPPSFSH
ncbi:hypothetical protein VNO77_14184 [Canavalia gladiata]|uniref:Uncharacterized protein n=1 Tax=Canavalia gladiata TaxID=3824 RepID=A0AAN9QNL7_CANGL